MTRVRANTMIACPYGIWQIGDIAMVPDDLAAALVAQGHAEAVAPEPAPEPDVQPHTGDPSDAGALEAAAVEHPIETTAAARPRWRRR